MHHPSYTRATLFTIIGITVIAAIAGLLILLAVWYILRSAGIQVDFWTMASSLSTAFAAAAVLGAGFVAYRELNEVANSRHIEVANRLFETLNASENVRARRWIFQHLPDDPAQGIPTLTEEDQDKIKLVLNGLDQVAFLTQAGWIPDELVMPWMHPMIYKSWLKLAPYVMYERERRNEPYYYLYAENLAKRCTEWRKKHLPDSEQVKWVEDAL